MRLGSRQENHACTPEFLHTGSPCEGTVAGAAGATPTILAPQAATPAWLLGLATRKPMLLFSFAGLLLFRVDDDKLLELLFQLPPRTPRLDEPSIPIPLLAS